MIFHQRYGSWKRRSQAYSNGHEGKHTGGTLTVTPTPLHSAHFLWGVVFLRVGGAK